MITVKVHDSLTNEVILSWTVNGKWAAAALYRKLNTVINHESYHITQEY